MKKRNKTRSFLHRPNPSPRPIIDWFYKKSQAAESQRSGLEAITVDDLLVEIKAWNRTV